MFRQRIKTNLRLARFLLRDARPLRQNPAYLTRQSLRYLNSYSICYNQSNGSDEKDGKDHIPWYLRIEDDSLKILNEEPNSKNKVVVIPQGAPDSLSQIIDNLKRKLALRDIVVFDLKKQRESEVNNHRLKSCDYVIICTALSPKHCEKSFTEINKLLKNKYKVNGYVEGNLNPNDEKKRLKRLARKTNLGKTSVKNSKSNLDTDSSWYMIDCKVDRIFLNVLTKSRRDELNLEELYAPSDEKHLYDKQTSSSSNEPAFEPDINNIGEDDNILSALRTLAQQRRHYSTKRETSPLHAALLVQNFDKVNEYLIKDPFLRKTLLNISLIAINELKNSKKDNADIDVFGYSNLVKRNIPLHIHEIPEFWDIYKEFLSILLELDYEKYSFKAFIQDYFQTKKALGEDLTAKDLNTFLDLLRSKNKKHDDYWGLVKENLELVRVLRLFDEDVIFSEETLPNILRSLASSENKVLLHSFYEVVNYLVDKYNSNIPYNSLCEIMKILIDKGDFQYLIKLWQVKIGYRTGEADTRPWKELINLVIESNEIGYMKALLENGILLDIRRANVPISQELRESLTELFHKADPDQMKYNELRHFFLD
ncbi:ATPase synthesis protein 25, mitochondrial [Nakaseomyces bracarensis]|uniref:ATPase synthesis protein 25 n=1 Tax=Nakaseomyces bracarensis TaxID=273131 RepID=A0ABR4NXY8_9SACH